MNVEFEEHQNTLIIKLCGELDHHSMITQKSRIEMKLSTNTKEEIIFDLNGLSFMDSSGISLIYGGYKIAVNFGQKVTVLSDNDKFIKILMLSQMDKFVKIVNGRECLK